MKQMLVELNLNVPIAEQMAEIVRERQAGDYRCLLLHVFSGIPDEALVVSVCRELEACCDTKLIVGSMSAGEIKDGRMIRRGLLISAMLFENSEVGILRFDDVKGNEVTTGIRIAKPWTP